MTYFAVLSAVVSFLVVGLVLQPGCVHLLLGVDTVRYFVLYCSRPPCCDHCAGFSITALVIGNRHKMLTRKTLLVSAIWSWTVGFYTATKPSTPLGGTAISTTNTSSCLLLLSNK